MYFKVRGVIFVLSGRAFLPDTSHWRVHLPFALIVASPFCTAVMSAFGKMQAFFGVYQRHFVEVTFFVDPKGLNVQEYFFDLPASLYVAEILILILPE